MLSHKKSALALSLLALLPTAQAAAQHAHGFGQVHMETSCAPAVSGEFDQALALLHNFWYDRALEAFTAVIRRDPGCGLAYWGAAMTYNHPFWDAPTSNDLAAAWTQDSFLALQTKGTPEVHGKQRQVN